MNIQDRFPIGLTGLISLQFKGTLKSLLQHHTSLIDDCKEIPLCPGNSQVFQNTEMKICWENCVSNTLFNLLLWQFSQTTLLGSNLLAEPRWGKTCQTV